MTNQVIAELAKNSAEMLKIELCEFNGHELVGIRIWTRSTDRPTKKGVTLRVGLIPALVEALQTAERQARGNTPLDG